MCGIAGYFGASDPHKNAALLEAIAHRGGDDQGVFTAPNLTLLHNRLSIVDIGGGHQPMERGAFAIVFNGEIYNHNELRSGLNGVLEGFGGEFLRDFGGGFTSRSDTETLIALYAAHGVKMFEPIDGMFAFALYDSRTNLLYLARDRYGKKPLYYSFAGGFAFASEINALKKVSPHTINHAAIEAYLRFGFVPFEHTAYNEIYELPAASYMIVNLADLSYVINSWNEETTVSDQPKISENEALDLVENALRRSVKNRLESSDVEVAAFLSGGIDSSLICYYAAQENQNLKTFTVSFDGGFDESVIANQTAKQIGSAHKTINIHNEIKNSVEKILLAHGEPFADSSCVPSFFVSQAARKEAKVVLNGDGADELFAGYRRYVPFSNHLYEIARIFSPLKSLLPAPNNKMSGYNYLYRLLDSAGAKDCVQFWLKTRSDIYNELPISNAIIEQARTTLENRHKLSALSHALSSDRKLLLFGDLLVKMDIASMAHALEARSPFLSRDMAHVAAALPDHLKIRGTTTKYILRKLAQKRLGNTVASAPKRGFEIPLKNWVQGELKEQIYDRILAPNALWHDYLPHDFVRGVLNETINIGGEKRAKLLWTIYALEVWYENDRIS